MIKKCIFGLGFGFITLFSFCNGVLVGLGQTSSLGDNTCTINDDLSIDCENSDHALAYEYSTTYNLFNKSIFWSEDGIGIVNNRIIYNGVNSGDTTDSYQGLLVDGFHICSGDVVSYISNSSYANGTFYPGCNAGFTKVGNYTYEQLKSKLLSKKPLYWYNPNNGNGTLPAIGLLYDDFYFVVWVNPALSDSANINNGNFVSKDLGIYGYHINSVDWNNYYIWYRPNSHYVGGGSIVGDINNQITGDYVYLNCTYRDVVTALESEGRNDLMCYGGLDNFDLYNSNNSYIPIPGSGLTISQIWGWQGSRAWDNFSQWYSFWHGLYHDNSNDYTAMWESYPAVYRTYFQLLSTYGGDVGIHPLTLLEYCNIKTFSGFDLGAVSSSSTFSPICETVVREKQNGLWDCRVDGTLYSGCELNPQYAIGVNWGGSGNVKSNGISFIQDYFNLIKSSFKTDYTGSLVGIVPSYIIIFMLAIILFRFISH